MKRCHSCMKELEIKLPVGRQDDCPHCRADLRCCLNCTFYVPAAYNKCRETQAERVTEKDRGNFCNYFVFRVASAESREKDLRETAKAKLEALFKMD